MQEKEDYALSAHEALAFLQHYGFPTRLFDFSVDPTCALAFAASREPVNRMNDEGAGFPRLIITEYVEAYGKLSPTLVDWLLARVPIAAYAFVVEAYEKPDVAVKFRSTSCLPNFQPDFEARCSLQYWSTAHPDCSFARVMDRKWPEIGCNTADPRTNHPDLYPEL